MSAREDRPEYCQRLQDNFEVFAERFFDRRQTPKARRVAPLYPDESHRIKPTEPERSGWRVSYYLGRGCVGRAYPIHLNIGNSDTPDFSSHNLLRTWDATCSHECWPMPHPMCGCGIWASPTIKSALHQLRGGLRHPGWRGQHPDADSRYIVYPVQLSNVRPWRDSYTGPLELVGASVRVTGPILSVHPNISDDFELNYRGLDVQVVGETSNDLVRHLEAMTQVSA